MEDPLKVLPYEILEHYAVSREQNRLFEGPGQLERVRTQEVINRHLPLPPATVADVGGGPGFYAYWLAARGYTVHLIDPVPLHIQQAEGIAQAKTCPLASASLGDARCLKFEDASLDVVLLMGPLYHLTDPGDRMIALQEALRVLRPGGLLFAVAISRFASLLNIFHKRITDPAFIHIVEEDSKSGQHRNPTACVEYFTTSFFHHPDELEIEVTSAGLGSLKQWPGRLRLAFERFRFVVARSSLAGSVVGYGPHRRTRTVTSGDE